ncbi:MAG: DUF5309 family protein [Alphaproteobacteria bacterium]|nr:DUF5309 family protein [Alphaproteobacteria bacterium]
MASAEAMKAVLRRLKDDFSYYSGKCLKIRTKRGTVEPLVLNVAQHRLVEIADNQWNTEGKVRIIVLKARQMGLSTAIGGWIFHKVTTKKAKRSAELKRDLEHAYVGLAQTATAGNASTARLLASVSSQIDASVRVNNASATALTENMILTANQNLYNAGSEASIIMCKPADSLVIANFAYRASGAERRRDVGDGTKIVNTVEVYRSPFGEQRVVLNRFIKTGHCIVYDPDQWRKVVLRPWFQETLGKTGDNTAVLLAGEYSLKHRNFKASSFINNLT